MNKKVLEASGLHLSNLVPYILIIVLIYSWWNQKSEISDLKSMNEALQIQAVDSYNRLNHIQEKLGKLDRSNWKHGKNKITIGN